MQIEGRQQQQQAHGDIFLPGEIAHSSLQSAKAITLK